ncbi:hypothetical protein AB1046_20655 [Promicromonospora sp. Populi]|uniref:hypothetical protein n=1 Tax=Promicromonospora sp. Populi TaxID=3239420 RepID=UPI0034E1BD31
MPSGQFQSGQFPSGQVASGQSPRSGQFGTGQPVPDQFATRSGANRAVPGSTRPPGTPTGNEGDDDGKSRGRRDWIWSVVAFLVAAVVIGAVGFRFFGPSADEATAVWAIESCAGPESTAEGAEAAVATYRPLTCDDPAATVTVLDIQDAVSVAQLHCPSGTDVVFQKDGQAGGETQAVCARNLSDDHPGDPGQGGGQLLAGDCVDDDGSEVPCTADGAHQVTGLLVSGFECPDGTVDELDLGFAAERSYETICLGD